MSQSPTPQQAVAVPAAAQPQYKEEAPSGGYRVEKREVIAQTPTLRMVILTLAPGQEVPWHFHHNVSDTFFCLEGPMVVHTREPEEAVELAAGNMYAVIAGRPHRVTGRDMGRCKFAILQGVGPYDFVPVK
jgi:quercetin dioxygenase-like cupin family protein